MSHGPGGRPARSATAVRACDFDRQRGPSTSLEARLRAAATEGTDLATARSRTLRRLAAAAAPGRTGPSPRRACSRGSTCVADGCDAVGARRCPRHAIRNEAHPRRRDDGATRRGFASTAPRGVRPADTGRASDCGRRGGSGPRQLATCPAVVLPDLGRRQRRRLERLVPVLDQRRRTGPRPRRSPTRPAVRLQDRGRFGDRHYGEMGEPAHDRSRRISNPGGVCSTAARRRLAPLGRSRETRPCPASASSVGVEPRPSRAPIRAASGGSRNVDASVGQAASAKTSAGVPSRTIRPSRMTTTRSNDSATKRMSWLIATTVRPAAGEVGRRSAGSARRRARPGRSSARRGRRPACPSRGSRRAPAASAASSRGRTGSSRRRSSRPVGDERLVDRAARGPRRAGPRFRGPNATSVRTVAGEDLAIGVLEGEPDRRAPGAATRRPAASAPSTRTRPSVGRSRPLKWRTRVDLPDPFWPTIATRSPRRIVEVDAVEGARRRRGRRGRGPRSGGRRRRRRSRRAVTRGPRRARRRRPQDRRRARRAPARAAPGPAARRPSAASRGSSKTAAVGPSSTIRPPSIATIRRAEAVEQVGLVLGDQERRPGSRPAPGAPRRRAASRPGRAARSARRG